MLTQTQINQFRTRAKAQGFNEVQIQKEIARKNQEITRQGLKTSQPTQPTQTTQPVTPQKGGLQQAGEAVASFVLPRISKVVKTISGASYLSKESDAVLKANDSLQKQSGELIKRAMVEKDPIKKKQLLDQSRELNQRAASNTGALSQKADQFQKTAGLYGDQSAAEYAIKQGVGVAGEAAQWLLPVGKIVQGAKLVKGTGLVSNILKSAITGGTIGAIGGITTPEDISLSERGKRTLTGGTIGALTSGAVTGVLGGVGQVGKKLISTNKDRINRLFRINPSERLNFKKSTGGMDFADEILKRDGKNISGKGYDELVTYFGKQKSSAMRSADKLLSSSKKTISSGNIVKKLESMIDDLAPKKGNIGQQESISKLKSLLKDIKANPKKISLAALDKLKQQTQKMAESSYSATGKATPTSKNVAQVASFIKGLIEKEVPGIKDKNRLVQLYSQAVKSLERTSAREAAKITTSAGSKAIQTLPTIVGATGGFALGGGAGAVQGAIAGQVIAGLTGSARGAYLSPEFQTKIISLVENAAKSQGLKNASKIASNIGNAVNTLIAKKASGTTTDQEVSQEEPVGLMKELTGAEDQMQGEGTITIRNKKTGETKVIKQSEASQYGIGAKSGTKGLPNKEDILTAMFVDIQTTGGKNLAKLNTMLTAYESVYGGKENKLSVTAENKVQLANSGLRALDQLETMIATNPDKIWKNVIPGKLGSRDYDSAAFRAVEGLLRARSGAAVPETEVRRYMNANLPRIGDTPEDIQFKLSSFRKDLEDVASSGGQDVINVQQ